MDKISTTLNETSKAIEFALTGQKAQKEDAKNVKAQQPVVSKPPQQGNVDSAKP